MPEAVLAGPNGQPAIDQETQQPLTMEELLRRRGMVAYGGVRRLTPPSKMQTGVDEAEIAHNAAEEGKEGTIGVSSVAPTTSAVLAQRMSNGTTARDAATVKAAKSNPAKPTPEQLEAEGVSPENIGAMEAAGLVAAGTAAAYLLYRKMRGNSNVDPSAMPDVDPTMPPRSPTDLTDTTTKTMQQPIDIQGRAAPIAPMQQIEQQRRLPAPQEIQTTRALAENKRRKAARSRETTLPNDATPQKGYAGKPNVTSGRYDKDGKLIAGTARATAPKAPAETATQAELLARRMKSLKPLTRVVH